MSNKYKINKALRKYRYILFFIVFSQGFLFGNDTLALKQGFFFSAPQYNKTRFTYAFGTAAVSYTAFSIGFYNAWYAKYERSKFHLFNDMDEWNQMDKVGHIYSGYFQSLLTYRGARWTGLSESKSILTGVVCGTLFQTTLEVMDGYSQEWGFSVGDIAANTIGIGAFYAQQKLLGKQIVSFKFSSWPRNYEQETIKGVGTDGSAAYTNTKERALSLYGSSWGERALKDYNVQTYWASVDMHSLLGEHSKWPAWLNLAVGYGADNMYGGTTNTWTKDGYTYTYEPNNRQRQYYLALDYHLPKIPVKSGFLKALSQWFNIYKLPAPAIEYNSKEGFKFHLILL
jgi:hypothetical protein